MYSDYVLYTRTKLARGVVYVYPPRVLLPYVRTCVRTYVRIRHVSCAAVFFLGDRHKFHRARGRSQESEIPTRRGQGAVRPLNMAAFEDLSVGLAYGFL